MRPRHLDCAAIANDVSDYSIKRSSSRSKNSEDRLIDFRFLEYYLPLSKAGIAC
jgi:hypothetical protein